METRDSRELRKEHAGSPKQNSADIQGDGKGGLSLRGGSLHDGFGGFGKHLALLLLVLQNTVPRGSRDGFDGFGGCGTFDVTATPLKLNPPFPSS